MVIDSEDVLVIGPCILSKEENTLLFAKMLNKDGREVILAKTEGTSKFEKAIRRSIQSLSKKSSLRLIKLDSLELTSFIKEETNKVPKTPQSIREMVEDGVKVTLPKYADANVHQIKKRINERIERLKCEASSPSVDKAIETTKQISNQFYESEYLEEISVGDTVRVRLNEGTGEEVEVEVLGLGDEYGKAVVDFIYEGHSRWAYVSNVNKVKKEYTIKM